MADRYWVQNGTSGTGNWNAITHWDAHSGDPGGDSIPTSADNVFFDLNSFGAAAQTVTINAVAACLDMDWTGATNSPTFTQSAGYVAINGDCTLITGMVLGGVLFLFTGVGNKTFTSAGQTILGGQMYAHYSNAGKLTLNDDLNLGTTQLVLDAGTFDTNGKIVTCGEFITTSASAKVLTLGASIFNCTSWNYATSALTLTANTATINCSGDFVGGGITTYNIVNLTGATSTVSGNNTFATLGFTRAGVQTISFTDGSTQTVTALARDAGTSVKTLQGTSTAGWAIAAAGAATNLSYVSLAYSAASPANKFYYGIGSTVGIGNSGWNPYQSNIFGIAGVIYMGDIV